MQFPIIVAQIAAIVYFAVGVGALLNEAHFRKIAEDFTKSPGAMYLGSLFAILLGYVILFNYNVWSWNWAVMVTVLGWAALIKGVVGLIFPQQLLKISVQMMKNKHMAVYGYVALLLGLVFAYFGFLAV